MEAVRDLYSQLYDARYPVICRDKPPKPRRATQWTPQPARPGCPATYDYAYVRRNPCTLWLCVEPLGRWRTARRTAVDRARQVQAIADHPRYRQAERLIRVCDNLNAHAYASFYRAFPSAETRRLARRVPRVFTPRHGSWLRCTSDFTALSSGEASAFHQPEAVRYAYQGESNLVRLWAAPSASLMSSTKTDWPFRHQS